MTNFAVANVAEGVVFNLVTPVGTMGCRSTISFAVYLACLVLEIARLKSIRRWLDHREKVHVEFRTNETCGTRNSVKRGEHCRIRLG